jgi:hypothetical protein
LAVSHIKRLVFVALWLLIAVVFLDSRLQARNADLVIRQPSRAKERASFPHDKARHKTLDCSKCHSVTTAEPDVKSFPGHVSCAGCHNLALEALSKPVLFCGICHEGRPSSRSRPALFDFPKTQVQTDFGSDFSHPSHLKAMPAQLLNPSGAQTSSLQTPRCTDCHQRTQPARAGSPEMAIETGHRNCFKCHGERPVKPPSMNQCAECHQLGGPHSPQMFGSVKAFKHEDHEFEIRPRKKTEYPLTKAPDYLCSECHSSVVAAESLDRIKLPDERYCSECHNNRLGLPEPLAQDVLDSLKRR